jgi:hypothetical protein
VWMHFNVWPRTCMRCISAVRAFTSVDLCLLHAKACPLWGAWRHSIHGLSGCGIPETVTHPSTICSGRCSTSFIGTAVVSHAPRHLVILTDTISTPQAPPDTSWFHTIGCNLDFLFNRPNKLIAWLLECGQEEWIQSNVVPTAIAVTVCNTIIAMKLSTTCKHHSVMWTQNDFSLLS